MPSTFYERVGRMVVWAGIRFLRRKYGPQLVPKPVIAGSILIGVVALIFATGGRKDGLPRSTS